MRLLLKEVCVFKVFTFQILRAGDNIFLVDRPVDANLWIVPADACLVGGSVDVVDFIREDSLWAQYQKAMGKAARKEELAHGAPRQLDHDMLAKSRRGLTKIDGHVEHLAFDNSDQLCLRVFTLLVMQATQYAVRRL